MEINKISFESFSKQLLGCFKLRGQLESSDLVPDMIGEVFKKSDKMLTWEKVMNWEPYECGEIDIKDEDFIKLMFKANFKRNSLLYIITDRCFKDKKAYCINYSDLEGFVKNEYSKLHQECFYKPEDIIFFNPNEKFISILHHSGFIGLYGEK